MPSRRMRNSVGVACAVVALGCEAAVVIADDGECGVPPGAAEALPGGAWLVEGDIELPAAAVSEDMSQAPGFRSAVKCGGTLDRAWDVGRKLDLSYCFAGFADATLRARAAEALAPATGQWERAAGINFVHRAALDGTAACASPGAVAFVVRQGEACGAGGCPLASASFPPDGPDDPDGASLRIWPEALQSERYTLETVLLHELGHLLGLVHEHSRFEQEKAICVDAASTSWRGLTFPDPASVMGDARCPGISEVATRGRLSAGDRLGAWILYSLPRAPWIDFDGDRREDVLWFMPAAAAYELWYGGVGARFARARHDLCDGTGPCDTHLPARWRPVALRGAGERTEVLMFGPRELEDERWLAPRGRGPFVRAEAAIDLTAVPVVADVAGRGIDAMWWLRPGDTRGPERSAGHTLGGYGWPLVGRWGPGAGDRVLWLDAQRPAVAVWSIGQGVGDMAERTACGLRTGAEQIARTGDFDGDGAPEVLWWDPRARTAVRWHPARLWDGDGRCRDDAWSVLADAGDLPARAVVGDFDGDRGDDLLWYAAGPGGESIWRLRGATPERLPAPPLDADATPCVGDFDGDGCDDVLWYAPAEPALPLWRARCDGDMAFETGETEPPPPGAYPVGCGG